VYTVIVALRGLRQENKEFKASLGYTARHYSKKLINLKK
jgi:hypothetical protein